MNEIIRIPTAFQRQIKKLCIKIEAELKSAAKHNIEVCKLLVQLKSEFNHSRDQIIRDGNKVLVREYYFQFVEELFGLKERVVYDYLKVGESPYLWNVGVTISKLHLLSTLDPERAKAMIGKNRKLIGSATYRELKAFIYEAKNVPKSSLPKVPKNTLPPTTKAFSVDLHTHNIENHIEDLKDTFEFLKNSLDGKPIPRSLMDLLKTMNQWSKTQNGKN